MGFRFRKTINLGNGFRVNLSKSGFGYSWGLPGYRVTKLSNGRKRETMSIPGTGMSYVNESSSKKNSGTIKKSNQTSSGDYYDANEYSNVVDVKTACIEGLQPEEYKKFLFKINQRRLLSRLFIIMTLSVILFYFFREYLFIPVISVIGFLSEVILLLFFKVKIVYEFNDELENSFLEYVLAWKKLASSYKIWQVPLQGDVRNSKNMAGAGHAMLKKDMKISFMMPWFLKSNISVPVICFEGVKLIVFPDKLLIIGKYKVGAVPEKDVDIQFDDVGFVEDTFRSRDSELIQYQWLHPNKDGGPDRRFKENKQLPVYKYGKISISSTEGLNEMMLVSNEKLSSGLAVAYKQYRSTFHFE